MIQIELVEININPVITIFHILKKLQKRQSMKAIEMGDIKKD